MTHYRRLALALYIACFGVTVQGCHEVPSAAEADLHRMPDEDGSIADVPSPADLTRDAGAPATADVGFAGREDSQSPADSAAMNDVVTTSPRPCASPGPEIRICEDFDAYPTDSQWTEAQVRAVFHVSKSGIGVSDCRIVADPAGDSGRGNVVACLQRRGDGGTGFQFQGQIGSHDEAYFAFDLYLPPDYEDTVGVKLPGLMGGRMGWASGGNVTIDGFSARHMYFSRVNLSGDGFEGYGNRAPRGLQNYCYWYDSRLATPEQEQKGVWYDTELPWANDDAAHTYHVPLGQWITIEQRVKLNSIVDGVPQEDGILQNWIDGQLMVDQRDRVWRSVESLKVDALFMIQYYGGPANDVDWQAPQDQHNYYDNFIVSTEPITH